ncbi:hypothetical protein DB346_05315 [Verrucomicrobia bacterium LW23]|nr:hypothetical protein DB346_05315 [Verrucomicrobia bacterium LW23]
MQYTPTVGGDSVPAIAAAACDTGAALTGNTAWLDAPGAVVPLPRDTAGRARIVAAFRAGLPLLCVRSDLQLLQIFAAPQLEPEEPADADPNAASEPYSALLSDPEGASPGSQADALHAPLAANYPPPPLLWETPISTSARGMGEEPGSYRTPRGWHVVAERFGEGQPSGAEFKSRKPTGRVWQSGTTPCEAGQAAWSDLILTRILWLDGVEPANASSYDRYIYIHGTNHEDRIGTPSSHGCVRLRNLPMLRLHDLAPVGTPVWIG